MNHNYTFFIITHKNHCYMLKQVIFSLLHMPKQLQDVATCVPTNGQQQVSQIGQQNPCCNVFGYTKEACITNTSYQHAPSHERTSYECMFMQLARVHRCHHQLPRATLTFGLVFYGKPLGIIRQ